MIANHEEAFRSLTIARQALADGNLPKAQKFAKKSLSLHYTEEASSFLTSLASAADKNDPPPPQSSTASSSSSARYDDTLRNRSSSQQKQQRKPNPSSSSASSAPDYTPEQLREVKRIRKIKGSDFYAVLGLPKDSDESDIKKAYRKLALVLHPDKNSAPGADEAFKIVSKAFSILSDPEKRNQYDTYGNDPDSRQSFSSSARNGASPFASGHPFANHPGFMFDGEIDPEVIFATFFGPGFRFQTGTPQRFPTARRQRPATAQGQSYNILQFMPLLLIISFSFFNWLFSGPEFPEYSFNPTRHMNVQLTSPTYQVPVYVHKSTWYKFKNNYQKHVTGFWEGVESTYINKLGEGCRREQSIRERAIQKARGWGLMEPDRHDLDRAKAIPTPSCVKLREFGYTTRRGF